MMQHPSLQPSRQPIPAWSWVQRRLREIAWSTAPQPPSATEQAALVAAVEWREEYQAGVADHRRFAFARWLRDTGRIGG